MKLLLYVLLAINILTVKSYAYLDPGSAGILQMILAFIAGAFASLVVYWNKFKNFISKIFKKKDKKIDLENK